MTFRLVMTALTGFFLLGGGGYAGYTYFSKPKPQTYIVCPSDIKQCKDGITVGRISPSCAFAVCPEDRPAGTGGIQVLASTPLVGSSTQTLEAIRENGGDYTCTVTTAEGTLGVITGTVYTSQGELRADFDPVTKSNVRAVPTHLLLGKTATYAWTDLKGSGITFVRGMALGNEKISDVLPLDHTAPHAFVCLPWVRDGAVLTPPSDVHFTDFTPVATTTLQ